MRGGSLGGDEAARGRQAGRAGTRWQQHGPGCGRAATTPRSPRRRRSGDRQVVGGAERGGGQADAVRGKKSLGLSGRVPRRVDAATKAGGARADRPRACGWVLAPSDVRDPAAAREPRVALARPTRRKGAGRTPLRAAMPFTARWSGRSPPSSMYWRHRSRSCSWCRSPTPGTATSRSDRGAVALSEPGRAQREHASPRWGDPHAALVAAAMGELAMRAIGLTELVDRVSALQGR